MRVPKFEDPEVYKFMLQVDQEMRRIDRDSLSQAKANRSVLLYSPSKKVYELKVDDSGVVITTLVAG